MAIDSSIALQAKLPTFDNPLTQYAQLAAIQNAQSTNRLADLTYSEKQREVEQTNALNAAYKAALSPDGTVDRNKLYTGLASSGLGSKLPAVQKGYADQDKATADLAQSKSKTAETDGKLAVQRQEAVGNTLGAIAQIPNPTPQHVVNGIQHLVDIGTLAPDLGQKIIGGIPKDPSELQGWLIQGRNAVMKAADQMKYTTVDANTVATNNNKVLTTGMTNATSLATNGATNATSLATNANTVNATLAGQDKGQIVQTDQGTMVVSPRTGTAQPATVNGEPLQGKLKDIPASVNTAIITNTQNLSKVKTAIDLLSGKDVGGAKGDANATGWKGFAPNGLLNRMDPQGTDTRAMISDIGSLVLHDRSGAAVTASESPRLMPFIPLATDDNATAKKKLTRFMEIYQQETNAMAETYSKDQGYKPNPVLTRAASPVAQVKAAVENGTSGKLAGLKPVSIQTAADYAKLPSGTVYTAPDGSQRTKQ